MSVDTFQTGTEPTLAGKRVIVTGASMGIGRAVAELLVRSGAHVVINARGETALLECEQSLQDAPGKVHCSAGSVTDYKFAGTLIQSCIDTFGGIDGLINCAGIAEPQGTSILDIEAEDWQQLIDIHLHGTFNTCRQAAPVMAKQGWGSIVNTSSHAFLGMFGGTGYAAGKGATNSLSMAMAADLREHGVNVNVVCPGAKTRLSTGADYEALIEDLSQRGLLDEQMKDNSLNPPDASYVAPLYAFLVSSRARDMRGRIFWGAGGYVGLFDRNPQQLLAMRNHQTSPPWRLQQIEKRCLSKGLDKPEESYNSLFDIGPFRFLARQKLLLKLAALAKKSS